MERPRHRPGRSLHSEVSSAFRVMMATLTAAVVLTSAAALWTQLSYRPEVAEGRRTVSAVERAHVAMIDVENSLRAYFLVRENTFLEPFAAAERELRAALTELDDARLDGDLAAAAERFRAAQQTWWDEWASRALFVASGDRPAAEVREFVTHGNDLFADYRAAQEAFAVAANDHLDRVTATQSEALTWLLVGLVGVAAVTGALMLARQRRLVRRVVRPVSALRRTVDDVAGGDLSGPPRVEGPEELVALRDGLARMTEALAEQQRAAVERQERTERLSTLDGLTGLANRRRFDEDLDRETELALRHARRLGFVMLDLDHFKAVNDTYGHQRGDQVLREVGAVLRTAARTTDSVYRYGGEEFAILVDEADAAAAAQVAERMRAAVEDHFAADGVVQTVSCGVASLPEHATSARALVSAADAALYAAKQLGRNRVEVAAAGTDRAADVVRLRSV